MATHGHLHGTGGEGRAGRGASASRTCFVHRRQQLRQAQRPTAVQGVALLGEQVSLTMTEKGVRPRPWSRSQHPGDANGTEWAEPLCRCTAGSAELGPFRNPWSSGADSGGSSHDHGKGAATRRQKTRTSLTGLPPRLGHQLPPATELGASRPLNPTAIAGIPAKKVAGSSQWPQAPWVLLTGLRDTEWSPSLVCGREALGLPPLVSLANKSWFWLSAARDPKPLTPVPLPKARILPPRRRAGPRASSLARRQCPAVLAVARLTADSTRHENHRGRDGCPGNDTPSEPPSPSRTWETGSEPEPGGMPNTSLHTARA